MTDTPETAPEGGDAIQPAAPRPFLPRPPLQREIMLNGVPFYGTLEDALKNKRFKQDCQSIMKEARVREFHRTKRQRLLDKAKRSRKRRQSKD